MVQNKTPIIDFKLNFLWFLALNIYIYRLCCYILSVTKFQTQKKKYKIILLYWLGSTWFISQTELEFNMKLKLELTIKFLILRSNTSTLSSSNKHVIKLIWFGRGFNSQLNKNLVRYEFIFQASIKLITRVINKPRFDFFFFLIKPYCSYVYSLTIFYFTWVWLIFEHA